MRHPNLRHQDPPARRLSNIEPLVSDEQRTFRENTTRSSKALLQALLRYFQRRAN